MEQANLVEIRKLEEKLKQENIQYRLKTASSKALGNEVALTVYNVNQMPLATVKQGANTLGGMVGMFEVSWDGKSIKGYQNPDGVFKEIVRRRNLEKEAERWRTR